MAAPPVPPGFDALARRPFAFYPSILNVEHNEWLFRKANWSEVLVVNSKSGVEIWIPRRLVGEVSQVDEPVMIVGLLKELEYKAGTVWPHERRILEMPRVPEVAPEASRPEPAKPERARLLGMSSAASTESRIGRLIGGVLLVFLAAGLLFTLILRLGPMRPVKFTSADQDFLGLSRTDDYFDVVRKLGPPASDRWRSESGELQYRALWYPQRSYYIILLGTDRRDAHYIGALDSNWRMIHSVSTPAGADTASMLRALPRF